MSKATEEEYVRFNQDIEGFWDGDGTVHFAPTGYKSFPSKKFKDKMSTIILGRALSAVSGVDPDGEPTELEAGMLIGVWYKPGMRDLLSLYGAKVKMKADGEKELPGKGNPMKVFAIGVAKGTVPKELPNLTPTPKLTTEAKKTGSDSAQGDLPSDDDIPF
jgi:hypothetical protein